MFNLFVSNFCECPSHTSMLNPKAHHCGGYLTSLFYKIGMDNNSRSTGWSRLASAAHNYKTLTQYAIHNTEEALAQHLLVLH